MFLHCHCFTFLRRLGCSVSVCRSVNLHLTVGVMGMAHKKTINFKTHMNKLAHTRISFFKLCWCYRNKRAVIFWVRRIVL